MDEKIKVWAKINFNQNLDQKKISELLNGKHGALLNKMFAALTDNVVSKKTAEEVNRVCAAHTDLERLKELEAEAAKILDDKRSSDVVQKELIDMRDHQRIIYTEAYLHLLKDSLDGLRSRLSMSHTSISCVEDLRQALHRLKSLDLKKDGQIKTAIRDDEDYLKMSNQELVDSIENRMMVISGILGEMEQMIQDEQRQIMSSSSDDRIRQKDLNDLMNHLCSPDTSYPVKDDGEVTLVTLTELDEERVYREERMVKLPKLIKKSKEAIKICHDLCHKSDGLCPQ